MKFLLVIFSIFFSLFNVAGQDINVMIKEADKLERSPNEIGAFFKFRDIVKLQPTNTYALSKCSELCSRIGKRQKDEKAMSDFYDAAKTFAQAALRIDSTSSDANCAMAMAIGHMSLHIGNKEKIKTAKDLRKYIDLAIKYNPNNYKAWHVLGRWHYEISNLNIFERAAVKLLYGGLPNATVKESIYAFERAQAITNGTFVLNCVELAKAYKRDGQKDKAAIVLRKMMTVPNTTDDDSTLKEEGKKILQDL